MAAASRMGLGRRAAAAAFAAAALASGCAPATETPAAPAAAAAYHADLGTDVVARTAPVAGAPPALGAALARALAGRLGPPASPEAVAEARRVLIVEGRAAGEAAGPAAAERRIATVLRVDWSVRDERGLRVGEFASAGPLAAPGALSGWDRADAMTVQAVAAGAAQRFRRLPSVKAALAGAEGF